MGSVAQRMNGHKREAGPDFLPTLEAARVAALPVKITEEISGRRYRYTHHYPAKVIDRIVAERRTGAVVVMTDLTRVRVKNITAVTTQALSTAGVLSSGPYYTNRGQLVGVLRIVPPNERT